MALLPLDFVIPPLDNAIQGLNMHIIRASPVLDDLLKHGPRGAELGRTTSVDQSQSIIEDKQIDK